MFHDAPNPEEDPLPPDEFESLEDLHKRMKEKQEAWRKLLERLDKMSRKSPGTTEPEKPSE